MEPIHLLVFSDDLTPHVVGIRHPERQILDNGVMMKLDTDETGTIRFKEVFNPIILETKDGESLCVCMRDTGFEVTLKDTDGIAKSYTMSSVGVSHFNPQTRKLVRWWCDTCDNSFVGMNGNSDICPTCDKRTRRSVNGDLRVANSVLLNYKVVEE